MKMQLDANSTHANDLFSVTNTKLFHYHRIQEENKQIFTFNHDSMNLKQLFDN